MGSEGGGRVKRYRWRRRRSSRIEEQGEAGEDGWTERWMEVTSKTGQTEWREGLSGIDWVEGSAGKRKEKKMGGEKVKMSLMFGAADGGRNREEQRIELADISQPKNT